MAGFRSQTAARYHARRGRRVFRRGRFKVAEVAAGFDVSRDVVLYAINHGRVPCERVGRRIWLNSESVVAFMKLGHALKL